MRNLIRSKLGTLALDARRENAERILNRRITSFEKKDIFKEEDMSAHFADEEIATRTFADLGDSSGIFLKAFGKRGTSVNIGEEPLRNIRAKGIKAIKADINGKLPFEDNSIDHILLFETLEHLPNPISAMREIHRICRKSLFVSIPYVSRTNIHIYNYCPEWPIHEHHIFEFNDEDFRKIASHTGFSIDGAEVVEVLNNGENLKELILFPLSRLLFSKNQLFGCFKKFTLYHMIK